MKNIKSDKRGYDLIRKNMRRLLPYQIATYLLALLTILISLFLVNQMQKLIDSFQKNII